MQTANIIILSILAILTAQTFMLAAACFMRAGELNERLRANSTEQFRKASKEWK